MNTLILENDRSKARTPRMSACKPVVCDSSVEDRTKPLGMFRTEIRRFTRGRGEARRSEEKRGEARRSRRKPWRFPCARARTSARSAGSCGDMG